jgi:Fe-S cluster biogenesis protein NfuA
MAPQQQENELRAAGDRIEALMGELAGSSPVVKAKAEELVRLLMGLYGAGLERILAVIDEVGEVGEVGEVTDAGAAGDPATRIFARLAADDLVSSLLVLHDLHPLDLEVRVGRALDQVRPYLKSHGGNVALLGVDDGVVRLRLEGSCHSCPSSTITMKLAIEKAIEEAAPEITRIDVEGVAEPGAVYPTGGPPELVQLVCLGASGGTPAVSAGGQKEIVARETA